MWQIMLYGRIWSRQISGTFSPSLPLFLWRALDDAKLIHTYTLYSTNTLVRYDQNSLHNKIARNIL